MHLINSVYDLLLIRRLQFRPPRRDIVFCVQSTDKLHDAADDSYSIIVSR